MTTKPTSTETKGATPGPYEVGEDDELNGCPFIPIYAADGTCVAEIPAYHDDGRPDFGERKRATARLVASAPMLEIIADLAGRYMWESLSETFHQQLSQARKAEILAAYRAFAGYREGRLSAEQAWEELASARDVLAAIESATTPRPRKITGRAALRVDDVTRPE